VLSRHQQLFRYSRQRLAGPVCGAIAWPIPASCADPEMVESRMMEDGSARKRRQGVRKARYFHPSCEHLPALLFRSLGERLAQRSGRKARCSHPFRGRHYRGIPISDRRSIASWKTTGTTGESSLELPPAIKRAGIDVRQFANRTGNVEEKASLETFDFLASGTSAGRMDWGDSQCGARPSASACEPRPKVKQQTSLKRMHDPRAPLVLGLSRTYKLLSTTTLVPGKTLPPGSVWGSGACASWWVLFDAVVRNSDLVDAHSHFGSTVGYLHPTCSIPFPTLAFAALSAIRNRMR